MKSTTIIAKIADTQMCSIATAELLTKALHREGRLSLDRAVRFRPLYGDFDIVSADFADYDKTAFQVYETIGTIENLRERFK